MSGATWTPIYDVRVDMQAEVQEVPIIIVYKAAIVCDTAEVSNAIHDLRVKHDETLEGLERFPSYTQNRNSVILSYPHHFNTT